MKEITFSAALILERKRIGWTRKKMSERTGIPVPTLESWEKEKAEPANYIKRLVLADLAREGRHISEIKFPEPMKNTSGLDKILGEIDQAVKGERDPIPYQVLIDALHGSVGVALQARIMSEICGRMGW